MPLPPDQESNWTALSQLLDEALALPPESRAVFVDSLSGVRAELRDTLRQLLAHTAGVESSDFLATLPRFTQSEARGALADLASGDTIGPYRLLHELGTGGMGSVWLAERADGTLKRKVALKLPRLSWAKGLAERMARERDILASLEHPHISRLYDAGLDQMGRPYLALEYVEGQPIDVYARERGLSVRQKLDLLLQVCEAVAFAHSRLVVHRDLKPGNILVTADGQVRLLDFGIAKLMEGDATRETQLTQLAGRALTLDYASPEQIKGEPIGTASDVYSLGVVTYELLTGARPYRLKRGSAAELEEAIASVDAPKASEVAEIPAVRKALRGDLDAILNQTLRKVPAARYATVDALAQDVRRHLADEPVSAQPDAVAYRIRKFLARYRVQVGATAFAVLALAAGAATALWQAGEAQRQRDLALVSARNAQESAQLASVEARRARGQELIAAQERADADKAADAARAAAAAERQAAQRAREQSERASAVQRYLVGIFSQSSARQRDPKAAQAVTARELLDQGAARLENDLATEPAVRLEMAMTLSELYAELGVSERSVALARTALALADQLYGADSTMAIGALALLLEQLRQGGFSDGEFEKVAARAHRAIAVPAPPSRERLRVIRSLAIHASDRNRPEAMDLAKRALREAHVVGDPMRIVEAEGALGRVAERRSDWALAERHLTSAISLATKTKGIEPFDLTIMRTTLAAVQTNQFRIPEAEATLRELLADTDARLGADHLDAQQIRFRLGSTLVHVGRVEEGLILLREALDSLARAGAERDLLRGLVLFDIGLGLRELGDLDAAESQLRAALAIRDRLRPLSIPAAAQREDLAEFLAFRQQLQESRRLLSEAERIRKSLTDSDPQRIGWDRLQVRRASVHRQAGEIDVAKQVMAQVALGNDGSPLASYAEISAALLRAAIDLDAGDRAAASGRLRRAQAVMTERGVFERAPQLARHYWLQCGRLEMSGGNRAAAERHLTALEKSLGAGYAPTSPIRVQLGSARLQPLDALRVEGAGC